MRDTERALSAEVPWSPVLHKRCHECISAHFLGLAAWSPVETAAAFEEYGSSVGPTFVLLEDALWLPDAVVSLDGGKDVEQIRHRKVTIGSGSSHGSWLLMGKTEISCVHLVAADPGGDIERGCGIAVDVMFLKV
jgi:hypothetical protein